MKLNAFTDICLRVLMTLGRDAGAKMTSQEIADRIGVPYNHVVKAVGELRRRGLVDVARGRAGGE
ncbi:Rrf2 family transcriptional regulator [Micrococcus porci]|uniref:Rrf2 family transcriptional regulator n=1 Tax=Micrococcus porci TaxID=2856555 RepID=UPI003CEEC98C